MAGIGHWHGSSHGRRHRHWHGFFSWVAGIGIGMVSSHGRRHRHWHGSSHGCRHRHWHGSSHGRRHRHWHGSSHGCRHRHWRDALISHFPLALVGRLIPIGGRIPIPIGIGGRIPIPIGIGGRLIPIGGRLIPRRIPGLLMARLGTHIFFCHSPIFYWGHNLLLFDHIYEF